MDVERPRPPSCHAPRRLPHVHEGDDEVPPRPAGLELRRPVRRAQPDPHAARQVQLGPRPLARSHADGARGTGPHPTRLVERRRHEGILEDPDRHVTPGACRPRALPVPILVTTVLPGRPPSADIPIGPAVEVRLDLDTPSFPRGLVGTYPETPLVWPSGIADRSRRPGPIGPTTTPRPPRSGTGARLILVPVRSVPSSRSNRTQDDTGAAAGPGTVAGVAAPPPAPATGPLRPQRPPGAEPVPPQVTQ